MKKSDQLQVAVLGASGIGRAHVREFTRAGAFVKGILGRSQESASQTAARLNKEFRLSLKPFWNIEELLNCGIDAVSIATPWDIHFEQIRKSLDKGLFVFCEKPLFWNKAVTPEGIKKDCRYLLENAQEKLALNICNIAYLQAYEKLYGLPPKIESFEFSYFAQGKHNGDEIGVDLLPHGISLINYLAPRGVLSSLKKEITQNDYHCWFQYTGIKCHFHFKEDPKGPKEFSFKINGLKTSRSFEVRDNQYCPSLIRDDELRQENPVADPFFVFISDFVNKIKTKEKFLCDTKAAVQNMQMVSDIILA
ncbi:MAG: Gfo/Idh/MocA family oxidoreductase [Candidatus Omnitrophota bacterium]